MPIIQEIIIDIMNTQNSLTAILLKTKVAAHKLRNYQLITWINAELNGYEDTNVPPYRKINAQLVGTLSNGFRTISNIPIPIGHLDEKFQEPLKTLIIQNSVSNLEEFLRDPDSDNIGMNLPPEICDTLSKYINYQIVYAIRNVNRTQIVQLLTNVKTKLLEILLELKEEMGDFEIMEENKIDNDKVDKIFNTSITGDGNTFVFGDHNYQNITTTIIKGDIKSLKDSFLRAGLHRDDVDELENSIKSDNPDIENKTYGEKVKTWISKMFNKALDGTWKIGTGAAGSLLAEAIKKYYGF